MKIAYSLLKETHAYETGSRQDVLECIPYRLFTFTYLAAESPEASVLTIQNREYAAHLGPGMSVKSKNRW